VYTKGALKYQRKFVKYPIASYYSRMGRIALKPSIAVGRLLRQRRKELQLTLEQVSAQLFHKGHGVPISTLARVERGELDPGLPRLHQLLHLYGIRPHLVSDVMDLEELAVEPPAGKSLQALFDDGVTYWKQGNAPQGLAHLFAVREIVAGDLESRLLRQKAILTFAIFARGLGKFELAHQMVEDLLREPPDRSILLNVLVLASSVWRGMGSLVAARAFLAQAETEVDPHKPEQVAWVSQQKAKLLTLAGETDQAQQAVDRAIEAYRAAKDPFGETKALLTRVDALAAARRYSDAIAAAQEVLARSKRLRQAQLEMSARIEIGRNLVASGQAEEGLDALSEALAKAMLLKERNGQFLAHYFLWKAYLAVGDSDRAALELESARYFVRFVDEASAEADEIRLLQKGGTDDKARKDSPPGAR
jgi:tetratricopeptide (TPR) repeat protein